MSLKLIDALYLASVAYSDKLDGVNKKSIRKEIVHQNNTGIFLCTS